MHLFSGSEIAGQIKSLGYSHVVWLPDSMLGQWESSLETADFELVRVCREGEAWMVASGLLLGGAQPLVMMQTTGLFESGDALRNALFDLKLPLQAVIGARSWLVEGSKDSAKQFTLPVLKAWGVDYSLIESVDQKPILPQRLASAQQDQRSHFVLIAEGRR